MTCFYLGYQSEEKVIESCKKHNITEVTLDNIKLIRKDVSYGLFFIKHTMEKYVNNLKNENSRSNNLS